MGEFVHHLERMLNEMKFFRQKKQIEKDRLQNDFELAEDMEAREQVSAFPRASCLCITAYTPFKPHHPSALRVFRSFVCTL
jgi:hypothetical protein